MQRRIELRDWLYLSQENRVLRATHAVLDLLWPDNCERLIPVDSETCATARITVDVPKDSSLVREGSVWRFIHRNEKKILVLELLAVARGDVLPHEIRTRRYYVWDFLIVRCFLDPFDWFPKPTWERSGEGVDILKDLERYLRGEIGEMKSEKFTSEGGLQ